MKPKNRIILAFVMVSVSAALIVFSFALPGFRASFSVPSKMNKMIKALSYGERIWELNDFDYVINGIAVHIPLQEITGQALLKQIYVVGTRNTTDVNGERNYAVVAKYEDSGEGNPELEWETTWNGFLTPDFNATGKDIVIDRQGAYIYVVGSYCNLHITQYDAYRTQTGNNPGDRNDIFIVKIETATGNVVWGTSVDVNGFYDSGNGIAIDDLGNVYIIGMSSHVSTASHGRDRSIFCAKYTPTANQINAYYSTYRQTAEWTQTYDSFYTSADGDDFDKGNDIIFKNGFLFLTGCLSDSSYGVEFPGTVWIAKLNTADGDLYWERKYSEVQPGESHLDSYGEKIICDQAGYLHIIGSIYSRHPTIPAKTLILKYNASNGNFNSAYTPFPSSSIPVFTSGRGIVESSQNKTSFIAISGPIRNRSGEMKIIIKTPNWEDKVNGRIDRYGFSTAFATDITADKEGYIYAVGKIGDYGWMAKYKTGIRNEWASQGRSQPNYQRSNTQNQRQSADNQRMVEEAKIMKKQKQALEAKHLKEQNAKYSKQKPKASVKKAVTKTVSQKVKKAQKVSPRKSAVKSQKQLKAMKK